MIEIEGNGLKDFKIVGRCRSLDKAFEIKGILKQQTPSSSFKVSVILDD